MAVKTCLISLPSARDNIRARLVGEKGEGKETMGLTFLRKVDDFAEAEELRVPAGCEGAPDDEGGAEDSAAAGLHC